MTTDVIVVGAGLAGLTAAQNLVAAHLDVIVLEARNRVGGRLLSVPISKGFSGDLGAQWIGSGQERMYTLAKRYAAEIQSTNTKGGTLYDFQGKQRISNGRFPPFNPITLLDIIQFSIRFNLMARSVTAQQPWLAYNANRWDEQNVDDLLHKLLFTDLGYQYWKSIGEIGSCYDLLQQSVLDGTVSLLTFRNLNSMWNADEHYFVNGAQLLAEHMAAQLPTPPILETPVREIYYNSSSVCIRAESVECFGKQAIIAVPPILAGRIDYYPSLPTLRQELTRRAPQGAVIKCIVVYESPFWRCSGLSGLVISDRSPIKVTYDCSPIDCSCGVLVTLICGRTASELSKVSQSNRREVVIASLIHFFGSKASAPIHYIDLDWTNEFWSKGGYGLHFAPKVTTQFGSALVKPIGPIHWAGTETATEWRNYMEGAVESGERAATEVIAAMGVG